MFCPSYQTRPRLFLIHFTVYCSRSVRTDFSYAVSRTNALPLILISLLYDNTYMLLLVSYFTSLARDLKSCWTRTKARTFGLLMTIMLKSESIFTIPSKRRPSKTNRVIYKILYIAVLSNNRRTALAKYCTPIYYQART